jgi:hypothetical protein
MKDWQLFVLIGTLVYVGMELITMPDGSIIVRIVHVLVEMIMRIG